MKDTADCQNFALNDLVISPWQIDSGSVASQFASLWDLCHLAPAEDFADHQIELCCDNALKLL